MSMLTQALQPFCIKPRQDAKQTSPLALAYMGDTVYDLYVRTLLLQTHDETAHGFHMRATKIVCAKAQAQASERVLPLLTPDETAIFKRGRNAHMGTIPKNASVADYRAATGLEAVLGYLYLSGDDTRIQELMKLALAEIIIEKNNTTED